MASELNIPEILPYDKRSAASIFEYSKDSAS